MKLKDLAPGDVAWAALEPTRGREQSGHRPVLVIASADYLEVVTTLTIVIPITTVDRGWPNHIAVRGVVDLEAKSWVMTEQIRTISRNRITDGAGRVSEACLAEVRLWIADFLDLKYP